MAATDGVSPAKSSPVAESNPGLSPSASFAGRIIKQFKLVDEIGEGANGRVFVAEDTVLRRHVALKLMSMKYRDGRPNDRAGRLVAAARAAAAAVLEHPNIVAVHEIDSARGIYYIAMELVEGGNSERLVQEHGPIEIERAAQLVAEAAAALAHAHQRGIVHRDVKPANLLLTRSGRCKVCDFALAMVETCDEGGKLRCVGTPYFVAPEVALGKSTTAASDIYSLGCTLFFLLSGRPPFPAPSARQVLKMHASDPLPDIRHWRADASPRLVEAIAQACAKDPQARYVSAEQFAAVLRTFTIPTPPASRSASHFDDVGLTPFEGVAPAPPPAPAVAPRANRSSRRWLAWGGAAVAAVAIVIAVLAGPGMWPILRAKKAPQASLTRSAPRQSQSQSPQSPSPRAAADAPSATSSPDAIPAAAASAAAASSASSSAASRAVDGASDDMEDDDGRGDVRGWNVQARYKPQVTLTEEAGNHFLRVTNTDASKIVYFDRKIKLDPSWVAVTVSARMRSNGFKAGSGSMQDGRVAILFKDEAGTRIGNYPNVPNVRTDSGWTVRSATADVPPGAKSLQLQAGIFNATGAVDFDDITVVPQR